MREYYNYLMRVLFVITMVAVILVAGCGGKTYTYNSVYMLPDRDLVERKQSANGGNSQAAFDVYLHYKFGINNQLPAKTMYWLKKSVALGNVTASQHLQMFEKRR